LAQRLLLDLEILVVMVGTVVSDLFNQFQWDDHCLNIVLSREKTPVLYYIPKDISFSSLAVILSF